MTVRRDHRASIERIAQEAFADHVLHEKAWDKDGVAYVWLCQKPGSYPYSFWVANVPGCIAQYGDIGDLMIAQGYGYGLLWLEESIQDMDYVLQKSTAKRDMFVPELFQTYVREHAPAFEFEYGGDEMDAYRYYEETGDSEFDDCVRDWPTDALWGYWALRKFVELRRCSGK